MHCVTVDDLDVTTVAERRRDYQRRIIVYKRVDRRDRGALCAALLHELMITTDSGTEQEVAAIVVCRVRNTWQH